MRAVVVKPLPLLIHLAFPLLAGAGAAWLAGSADGFYPSPLLPRFAPPSALFAAVWNVLYLLMGLSSYQIHTIRGISRRDRSSAFALYGLSLLMSFLWSLLFFRFRFFTLSACWSVVAFATAALCAAVFYRIRRTAGLLLAPGLAWLAFVSVLSFSVAALNQGL